MSKIEFILDNIPSRAYNKSEDSNLYKLLSSFADELDTFVENIEELRKAKFIDTATNADLDRIAQLLNMKRFSTENDDIFRARVKSKVQTFIGGGTTEAIKQIVRIALGIEPKIIEHYKSGNGFTSFTTGVYKGMDVTKNTDLSVKINDGFTYFNGIKTDIDNTYNSKNITNLKLVSDFTGKVIANNTENPNKAGYSVATSLAIPNATSEYSQTQYNNAKVLDGTLAISTLASNGAIMQHQFSFDIISLLERKYGEQIFEGKTLLADKIAIVKILLTKMSFNWHGYGSSPTGNKATIYIWNGTWFAPQNHTSSSITKLNITTLNPSGYIQSDGFVHFLAHAEPSNGTISSVISTDYINLELELFHNINTLTNNFNGKVVGSTAANPHFHKAYGSSTGAQAAALTGENTQPHYDNMMTLNGTINQDAVTGIGSSVYQQFSFDIISILERKYSTSVWRGKTLLADKITIAKNLITSFIANWYGTGSNKTGNRSMFRAWNQTNSSWFGVREHWGSAIDDLSYSNIDYSSNITNANNMLIGADGFAHFLAYANPAALADNPTTAPTLSVSTNAGSTLPAATYYVRYSWNNFNGQTLLSPESSIVVGSGQNLNVTVPTVPFGIVGKFIWISTTPSSATPTRIDVYNNTNPTIINTPLAAGVAIPSSNTATINSTINTDYIELLLDVDYSKIKNYTIYSDFNGKISGSVVENPHIGKRTGSGSFLAPSLLAPSGGWSTELDNSYYPLIQTLNGSVGGVTNSTNTTISQMLFSFDIIKMLELQYGIEIWNGVTLLADKIIIAKEIITKINGAWHGFGSGPAGNKATLARWRTDNSSWYGNWTHTSGSVTRIYGAGNQNDAAVMIDTNGFVHFIAYADASNGTTASVINTDYIELELETSYIPVNNIIPLRANKTYKIIYTNEGYQTAVTRNTDSTDTVLATIVVTNYNSLVITDNRYFLDPTKDIISNKATITVQIPYDFTASLISVEDLKKILRDTKAAGVSLLVALIEIKEDIATLSENIDFIFEVGFSGVGGSNNIAGGGV